MSSIPPGPKGDMPPVPAPVTEKRRLASSTASSKPRKPAVLASGFPRKNVSAPMKARPPR